MTTKAEFLTTPCVTEFINWLQQKLPELEIKLRILPSRFVPGGLERDIVGIESALEHYCWRSQWTDALGHLQMSHTWPETRVSLNSLGQWLQNSIANENEDTALQASFEILRWGGVYKWGSINFLNNLAANNLLVTYLSNVRNAMALNHPDNQLNELDGIIQLYNSGITKIHALASTDGLPIYDSRVGATISALGALFSAETGQNNNHLLFPTGAAIGNQLRNPGDFPDYQNAPKFYTNQVTHAQWAQAQVKLGWIFENLLRNNNWFAAENNFLARMHALEAAFFMIGYDLRALSTINDQPVAIAEELPQPVMPANVQINDELQLYNQRLEGNFVPTGHNFSHVIVWYHEFRQENINNHDLLAFAQWLLDHPDNNINQRAAANAYLYPLRPSQFDIINLTDEQVRDLATNPTGEFSTNFLNEFQGLPIEEIPRCLIDTFIVGCLTRQDLNGQEIANCIVEKGFAGTNQAANTLRSVGKSVGVHFGLLFDENPPQPTDRFFELFMPENQQELEHIQAQVNEQIEPFELNVRNSRWYVQAERWLNILGKATLFCQGQSTMLQLGKAAGPFIYDANIHLLRPVENNNATPYQGELSRSTVIAYDEQNVPPINPQNFNQNYQLQSSPDGYIVGAGFGNLNNATQYIIFEPYADYGFRQLYLRQHDIDHAINLIQQTAQQIVNQQGLDVEGNNIADNQLDGFIFNRLGNSDFPLLILQGPPGTGKTYTLAKTVQNFIENGRTDIVCMAKTKRAVDEISSKLAFINTEHTNRNRGEMPQAGLPHCCTIDSYLAAYNMENRKILLIDEASQLTLPFILLAMRNGDVIRLFGDQKQLHPIIPVIEYPDQINANLIENIISKNLLGPMLGDLTRNNNLFPNELHHFNQQNHQNMALFNRDTIEQLIRTLINHPMGHSIFSLDEVEGIDENIRQGINAIRFRLTQGWRMSEAIQCYPNRKWYDGHLRPPQNNNPVGFNGAAGPLAEALHSPVVFISYPSTNNPANTNDIENTIIGNILEYWRHLLIDDFGIVVPFRAQEAAVREQHNLEHRHCATVERFQGRDLTRAIVSLTTNHPSRFSTETRIFTENKYNVAITRAKEQLVVIGATEMFDGTYLQNLNNQLVGMENRSLIKQYPLKYIQTIVEHYQHYNINAQGDCSYLHYDNDNGEFTAIG